MDDRTMLELAAKAAGINARWFPEYAPSLRVFGGDLWNPLTDDGDALRLAVKLFMALTFCADGKMHAEGLDCEYACESMPDHNLAARRAITRAAAEIQLSKESGK